MSSSRSNYHFDMDTSLTGDFKDTMKELKFTSRHVKISTEGANLEFVLTGADNSKFDGVIKPSDGLVSFDGLEINRYALRQSGGAVSEWRLFAYK